MHPRTVVMLLIGFLGGLGLAACGTTPMCSAATCGGCCDQTGKCQSGATADACGVGGASCGRCGVGTLCQAGECRASSMGGGSGGGGATGGGNGGGSGGGDTGGGTGGGMTGGGSGGGTTGGGSGGGSGGGTGGGSGCREINVLAGTQSNLALAEYRSFSMNNGHYNLAIWGFPLVATPDGLRIEVVYPGDNFPQLPVTGAFNSNTRYGNCTVCALFYEDCPTPDTCSREYLAQAGSLTITRADPAPAGRLAGSGTSLRFNEWDVQSDMPAGNRCIIVNTISPFDIGWNADGGAIPP